MPIKSFDEIVSRVKQNPHTRRVALAGAQDPHALEAVLQARRDGVAHPVLVGDTQAIHAALASIDEQIDDADIHHAPDADSAATLAVQLVREGRADFLMKGAMQTAELLRAVVNRDTGLHAGGVMSHVALVEVPTYHKLLVSTDGGMLLYPTLEQKAALLQNAVAVLHALGYDRPKAAILAAVETYNPKMPESVDALRLKEMNRSGELTGCIVEGPISLDLALVAQRSLDKHYESEVAGDADILVVPDITAGNLLVKSMIELAGANMAGIITGAKAPIVLPSRGSSTHEKYLSILLAAAVSG